MKIVAEDDKSYTVLIDGEEKRLVKFDIEEIKLNHISQLQEAAKYISTRNIAEALFFSDAILKNPPSVVDYEAIAINVTKLLERIHFDLKSHNLINVFHSLMKNINPEIYGKAQTFMNQIEMLNNDLKIIKGFKNDDIGN